jgi:hypothetical protein
MTTTIRIIAAAIALLTLLPVAGAHASNPPIEPIKPLDVKWILPPRSSGDFYLYDKWFTETMGYETVENGDLTYPSRP